MSIVTVIYGHMADKRYFKKIYVFGIPVYMRKWPSFWGHIWEPK